jgi:hypothetical protein
VSESHERKGLKMLSGIARGSGREGSALKERQRSRGSTSTIREAPLRRSSLVGESDAKGKTPGTRSVTAQGRGGSGEGQTTCYLTRC